MRSWLLITVLALGLASVVHRSLTEAGATRDRWGRRVPVWVTAHPVRAGALLADAVRVERWPAALVPAAALDEQPDAERARASIDAGVALTESMADRAEGAADRRTVAIPLTEAPLPVRAGDRVDVWATADAATVADGAPTTRRVATGAVVVDARDRSVVVAVTAAEVRTVTEAAASAALALVGTP